MSPTVIYEYDGKVLPTEGCVLTLGFFDGVHIAHRDLINKSREIADDMGIPLGVFTFRADEQMKPDTKRLYSTEERLEIFREIGVDFVVLVDFTSVRSLSPEDFVKDVLVKKIGCKIAVVGYNFRFGKNAQGDADTLCKLMAECGGRGEMREELTLDGQTISATLVRSLLEQGRTEEANRLLGKPFRLFSTVEHGNGMGKSFGYPTINTKIEAWRISLRRGVYRTAVKIKNNLFAGLTNIGVCPTFKERELHAETYILDFAGDLYGEKAEIFLLEFMRDEMRFESEKELIMQINIDKKQAIEKNGEEKWQELGLK